MKQFVFTCAFLMVGMAASAQSWNRNHNIYKMPATGTPKVITKLGTDPQFQSLRRVSDKDVILHNFKELGNNGRYKNEINSLFVSIGYNGVNDPSFGPEDLTATEVPFGAIGMLGNGSNNYQYCMIAIPNQPAVKCWKVKAANSNPDLYFMSECGNAFYYANAPQERIVIREVVKPVEQAGTAKLKVKVYARYTKEDQCNCCEATDDAWVYEEKALLAEDIIEPIPVTAGEDNIPVKKIYIDVEKAAFRKIKTYDVNGKYDKHADDDQLAAY